jgi:hypothetical protein
MRHILDTELERLKLALVDAKRLEYGYSGRLSGNDMKIVINSLEKQIALLADYDKGKTMDETKQVAVRFDEFKHSVGVAVVALHSGRKGKVLRIEMTGYEFIEPVVQWDDGEISRVGNDVLYLADGGA